MSSRPSFLRVPSVSAVVTAFVVGLSSLFVFSQLHPELLFADTTAAGGDMGAHVWGPQFLRDHVLPHGRITGWTNDWYNGFPALTFYFPLPSVLIVLLDLLLPYGVAFKLVSVLGMVSLPVAAWAFGRLARLPFPAPACLAAATLPFLFDQGYTILGGNMPSTLAGEFAFSIALSLAFVFLGVVAGGLETGKRRALASVLFGLTILCHILPTAFAFVGGVILLLMRLATGRTKDEKEAPPSGEPGRPLRLRAAAPFPFVVGLVLFAVGAVLKVLKVLGLFNEGDPAAGHGWLFAGVVLLIVAFALAALQRDERAGRGPVSQWQGTRAGALYWAVPVGACGALISAFWLLPFVYNSPYMNDMGWEKIGTGVERGLKVYGDAIVDYGHALFPGQIMFFPFSFAVVSSVVTLLLRRRVGIFFVLLALTSATVFMVLPQGRLWNARILPFWYFSLYMLAGLLLAEIGWGLANALRRIEGGNNWGRDIGDSLSVIAPIGALLGSMLFVMAGLTVPSWWNIPGGKFWHKPASGSAANFIPSWAEWNYSGYEEKPAYPEYKNLVDTMDRVGKTNGCGRAMWEYEPTLDRFGTPMALMLLPVWTDGCIGSQEGLFFESSATVPYHFLDGALLSAKPSSAMRNLPYGQLNVAEGVTRLQAKGVKYYMAVSPEAQQQANADPRLTLVATSPAAPAPAVAPATETTERRWAVYSVAATDLVSPLVNLPAVMTKPNSVNPAFTVSETGEAFSQRTSWLANSVTWYQDSASLDVLLADSGPPAWPRVDNANQVPPRLPTEPVKVGNIFTGDDRISFDVDRVGVPVVVRASYFPNWNADGADGPYRVTPNLMVVVPTSKHVELQFGRTAIDWLGTALTALGLLGALVLFRVDRRTALLARNQHWTGRVKTESGPAAHSSTALLEEPSERRAAADRPSGRRAAADLPAGRPAEPKNGETGSASGTGSPPTPPG